MDNLFVNNDDLLIVDKKLVKLLGNLNEAIVLNQLNYWIVKNTENGNNFQDGCYWVYSTLQEWQSRDFPFWSIDTIKRIFNRLERQNLVITGMFNSDSMDRTKWYTVNYQKLQQMLENTPLVQNAPM